MRDESAAGMPFPRVERQRSSNPTGRVHVIRNAASFSPVPGLSARSSRYKSCTGILPVLASPETGRDACPTLICTFSRNAFDVTTVFSTSLLAV